MRTFAARCGLLLGLLPLRALGGENPTVRLDYRAPSSCPDARAFEAEVRARLRQSRIAEPDEAATTLRILVTEDDARATARLFVGASPHATRELSASSCDELIEAMALVTAMAIEAPREEPLPSPSASPQPLPEPALAPAPIAKAAPRPLPPPPSNQTAPPSRHTARIRLGLRAALQSALAPEPLLGGQLVLGWEHSAALELRAFASWLEGAAIDAGPGRARFRLLGGGAEACGALVRPASAFDIGPCLGVEAGALRGEGLSGGSITEAYAATRLWGAGRALGRLQWRPGRLATELAGGAVIPLVRQSFVFEAPDTVIHETPALGWTLAAGASVSFP